MIEQTKEMNGPARAAYMRSERTPLPMIREEWLNEMDICFITGKVITSGDDSRFTHEFDAWVSTAGQNMIDEWVDQGMKTENPEWEIIYREWYAQDAAAEANDNNDYFRRNHK